ncbi:MAG: RHS repeat protein [Acidobacteria bacterium]|nr:RHS repeat protein [Acidobacteriota bacterium]
MKRTAFLTAAIAILAALSPSFGQEREPQRGFRAGNSYSISDIENVNLNNGNLMLTIPLASLAPGRGTSPGYTVSLRYNGKLWDSRQERRTDGTYGETGDTNYMRELLQLSEQAGWKLDTGGFRLILKSRFNLEEQAQCTAGNGYEYRRNGYIFRLEMEMPDGSVKEFRPYGTGSAFDDEYDDGWFSIDPNGSRHVSSHIDYNGGGTSCSHDVVGITSSGMNYYTNDGSGLRLFVPAGQNVGAGIIGKNWTLYMPGGTTVENLPPDDPGIRQRMTDANGNRLVWKPGSYGGSNGEMIEDGAGHFVFITTDANGTQRVIQRGFGGADVETEIRWKTCWVYRNYKATSASNANGAYIYEDLFEPIAAVEKIILPGQAGGREYVFTYNAATVQPGSGNYTSGWGELKSVTLPSEARADYSFQLDGNAPVLSSFDVLNNPITRRDLVFAAEYDGGQTEVTESTVYSASATGGVGSVLRPGGRGTVEVSDTQGYFKGYAYKTLSSNGSMVERIWAQNPAPRVTGANSQPVNAYVKTELTTIADNSGNPVLTAIKDFDYDKNGNVLAVREYDWVPYLSVPRSGSGIYSKVTALPSGLVLKRKTVSEYYNQAPPASDTTTDSPYHYANPSAPRLRNLLKSSEVRDANDTTVSRTEFYYDDPNNKGNLTETRVWDSTKDDVTVPLSAANSVITSVQYNAFGAPTVTTDANGVQTAVTYGCIDGAASCSPNLENLYPTKIEKASNHSALKLTLAMRYDYFTGLPTLATDVDNGISTATYYDDLGRPVKVASAVGTDDEVWVQTEYDVVNRRVITRADVAAKGDGGKVAAQFFDQLGRVRLTKSLEDAATQSATNETDGIKVQTRYLTTNGYTYQLSSNPYRASVSSNAGSEESMGWTRSKAWSTGIRSEVETFAGSSLPAPWGSNTASTGVVRTDLDADRTLVTDQSGKQRISRTNGLGQLKEVWEIVPASDSSTVSVTFPGTAIAHGYRSAYNYDPLNNLTQVDQPLGATTNQVRSFTYSSLSRLLTAQNPESGTISYAYDPNGNLTSKKDARNITTAYSYDALNRVTQRTYDDNATLPVYYTYDNLSHAKGKLTKVTTGPVTSPFSVTEYTEFDAVGRVKKSKQTTDGTVYNEMEYKYNLSGAMVEAKYPSGRIVKTVLDDEGDLQTVKSQKNANNAFWNYANHFTYTAAGAVASMQLGNGTWEKTAFNSRLQPTQIGLGKVQNTTDLLQLDYTYGVVESSTLNTAKNNGNIQSQTITVPNITGSNGFTAVQTYSYDSLNRIDDATEMVTPAGSSTATQSWKQDYTFDRYGNRNFVEANTTTIPEILREQLPGLPCGPQGVQPVDLSIDQQDQPRTGRRQRE